MQPPAVYTNFSAGVLEDERRSAIKCEYVAGHIYAMVGISVAHNLIAGNLYTALGSHLRGGPCRVFMADLKVYVEKAQAFYYPDVAVSCYAADTQPSAYCIENPTLIIEVLSPSTERIDREEKLHNYQMLERLQEYVLVAQERREVQNLSPQRLRLGVGGLFNGGSGAA